MLTNRLEKMIEIRLDALAREGSCIDEEEFRREAILQAMEIASVPITFDIMFSLALTDEVCDTLDEIGAWDEVAAEITRAGGN